EDAAGPAILVVSGSHPRHPSFKTTHSGSVYTLAYDDDAAGTQDIYTIDIDTSGPTVSAPVRRTFDNTHAESDPSYGPAGFLSKTLVFTPLASSKADQIAFTTNAFGPKVIEIVDTTLPSSDPNYPRLAEVNFNFVSHQNPSWAADGNLMYYDAPTGENPSAVSDVWQLDMGAQAKCEIQFDIRADGDPSASNIQQRTTSVDNLPYFYFLMTSQAGGFGVAQWRANSVNSCTTPLQMGVSVSPSTINLNGGGGNGTKLTTVMNFPAETKALGYVCRSGNTGGEGVRNRSSIFVSPGLLGLGCPTNDSFTPAGLTPTSNTECFDTADTLSFSPLTLDRTITCFWDRRTIVNRLTPL